jgi:hypothetical protein
MTENQGIDLYYRLRNKYNRRTPARTRSTDGPEMAHFLGWCAQHGVSDVTGYMTERFRRISVGSRNMAVPRISQLASPTFLDKWVGYIATNIASAKKERRLIDDCDSLRSKVRTLMLPPLAHKEKLKRRFLVERQSEVCVDSVQLTGGYHPQSLYCQQCPTAVRCAAALNAMHGFDVTALRSGQFFGLPKRIVDVIAPVAVGGE